jgi:hypothetical protein
MRQWLALAGEIAAIADRGLLASFADKKEGFGVAGSPMREVTGNRQLLHFGTMDRAAPLAPGRPQRRVSTNRRSGGCLDVFTAHVAAEF